MPLRTVTLLCLIFPALLARADIYRYVDEHGSVHLTDKRRGPGYQLIVPGKTPRPGPGSVRQGARSDYETMVERGIIATRQFAKRQLTWLRAEQLRAEREIPEFDVLAHDIVPKVLKYLAANAIS